MMMTKIRLSAYAACLLALLANLELGCATDPNQAGPSRVPGYPDMQLTAPETIPGLTEWLGIHRRLFSRGIDPENVLSPDTVFASIQRAVVLEVRQEFRMARLCLSNEFGLGAVRGMAQSQQCLQDIDGFLEALQEIAQIDASRRAQRLAREGQSVMEQLASLSRLDEPDLCEIESLRRVRDLMVLYQKWPNLHQYIWSQLDSRRRHCLTLFASSFSKDISQLSACSSVFELLERTQLRLGHTHNQQPPPFVPIPEFSDADLYHAIAIEIRDLGRHDLSFHEQKSTQRLVIRELRRKCKPVARNTVLSYYNQFIQFLDTDRLTPTTMGQLSSNTRHLSKLEICNRVLGDNFSARVIDEIRQIDWDVAQAEMIPPAEVTQEPSQENNQNPIISQAINQELDQPASGQVNGSPIPGSPRVESEQEFYERLANAVAENYQRDSAT